MSNLIYAKIDVTKIDKARLFEGKNGAKYLDLVLVPSSNSKYGDTHFITQSCSKEERQAGVKMPILGNAKEQAPREQRPAEPSQTKGAAHKTDQDDGDVPF